MQKEMGRGVMQDKKQRRRILRLTMLAQDAHPCRMRRAIGCEIEKVGGTRVCVATTSRGHKLCVANHSFTLCCGRHEQKPSTHTDSYTPAVYRSYLPNRYATPIPTDQPSGIGIPKSCSRSRQKLHLAVNFPEIVSRGVGVTEMPTPGR